MIGEPTHPMDPAFGRNRYPALAQMRETLGSASLSGLVMAVTGEYLEGHKVPHLYLRHGPIADMPTFLDEMAQQIGEALGTTETPRMLRTLTLAYTVDERTVERVLVGTVGRPIDTQVKREIASSLTSSGVPVTPKQAKRATINQPDSWNPAARIGLQPGVIGPLFLDSVENDLRGYYFLGETITEDDEPVPVQIALNPSDSLIMSYQDAMVMLPTAQAALVRLGFFHLMPPPNVVT